jgi:hypothetical protein
MDPPPKEFNSATLDPRRAKLLSDNELPRCTKSRMLPAEARRTKLRRLKPEPKLTKSSAESRAPTRAKVRRLIDDPRLTKSRTARVPPAEEDENVAREEPIRLIALTLRQLATAKKLPTERLSPTLPHPTKLTLLATRANERMLIEEPMCKKSKMLMLIPNR